MDGGLIRVPECGPFREVAIEMLAGVGSVVRASAKGIAAVVGVGGAKRLVDESQRFIQPFLYSLDCPICSSRPSSGVTSILSAVIVNIVPPKSCPPGHYSLVNTVPPNILH